MTLAEKVGQMDQIVIGKLKAATPPANGDCNGGNNDPLQPVCLRKVLITDHTGSILAGGTDNPRDNTGRGWAVQYNTIQRYAIEHSRLHIPIIFGVDAVHGFGHPFEATLFPQSIGMGATWDPALARAAGAATRRQLVATGGNWNFAPVQDLARDNRWGRYYETWAEAPALAAAIGAANIRGMQGGGFDDPKVAATVKHFAGYSESINGHDRVEAQLSIRYLQDTFLPSYAGGIDAGAATVMVNSGSINGVPAHASHFLLTEELRNRLGFRGVVISDYGDVPALASAYHIAADLPGAAAKAVNAGIDMSMTPMDSAGWQAAMLQDVRRGLISERRVNEAVTRILTLKFKLGLFDHPYVDEDRARQVLADPRHREVALVAAERSAVLLRNEGNLLPLDLDGLGCVAVVGPLADSRRDTLGPWVFDFDLDETVTVLDGIRRKVGDRLRVESAPGVPVVQRVFPSLFDMFGGNRPADPEGFDAGAEFGRAVDVAAAADVAVVVAGEWQNMIGEAASRSSLELPGRQLELLQAVVGTGTPTVLLVMNGRPLDLRWAAEHVPAILDVWYPGTQGGTAVANLLFGDVSPSGKLPFSWPRTVGQVPVIYSHTRSHEPQNQGRRYWDEPSTPLFPFGHGLSYGRFSYSDLIVDQPSIPPEGTITVSVQVTNTSERAAAEVVQLYLH
ncbi:MAG TPA: glycoside hydrolase family 3 N-terminal domain-containing protein, partial [Actinomycetes bacterium]|nr:glycoside hydrolase family 3 N-terminal domain-containing protein [Actinomycetes bacterium]